MEKHELKVQLRVMNDDIDKLKQGNKMNCK